MITFALLLWPVVIMVLFKRLHPAMAATVAIIGGYLLLPVRGGWDFPVLPTLDKDSITALVTFVAAFFTMSKLQKLPEPQPMIMTGWIPRSKVGLGLMITLVLGSFLTSLTNTDPLVFEQARIPALSLYHGFSIAQGTIVSLIPFILARKFLAYPEGHKTLLIVLTVSALLYSVLALYEIRFSPQLNKTVYGFFPHQWLQHIRAGGFRPVVFLHHGLWLGIFLCMCTIASAALVKIDQPRRTKYIMALCWLGITLLLSKNLGAFGIAVFLIPLVLFMSVRVQLLVALTLSMIIVFYPALRGSGVVPTNMIVSAVESFNPERASSLKYRLDNEDILLAKANERPFFGWGAYARNRVYDEVGRDISTTDGGWVIAIGSNGWLGYFSLMGLMALPIIFLGLNRRKYNINATTAGLALVLTANMIDLIPNSTITPVTWLVAGALLGRFELGRITEGQLQEIAPDPISRSAYTRQTQLLTRK